MRKPLYVGIAATVLFLGWWAFILLNARRRHPLRKCPACHSNRLRPSWPGILDKLFRLSGLVPYRCESCRARYYALPVKPSHAMAAPRE